MRRCLRAEGYRYDETVNVSQCSCRDIIRKRRSLFIKVEIKTQRSGTLSLSRSFLGPWRGWGQRKFSVSISFHRPLTTALTVARDRR